MARNPTTTSQVQAYRFVRRRVESALVRRDAVMLHEPMRTHLRATVVGAIVAVLGVAAFLVVGLFAPDDDLLAADIVVGEQSGAIYVVQKVQPLRLVPVRNLASARLLLANPAFHDGAAPAGPAEVRVVEESSLADAPRAPLTGIDGAPAYLPGPDRQVQPDWAVCDTAELRDELPDPEAGLTVSTIALVGVRGPGEPLGRDRALLVEAVDGTTHLLFDDRRAQVDLTDGAVRTAFGLAGLRPRPVSAGLLNAVPASTPLTPPDVPGEGGAVPFSRLAGQRVGDVVQANFPGTVRYFLLLRDGKQEVTEGVASLVVSDRSATAIPLVSPLDISTVPDAPPASRVDVEDYPEQVPDVVATPASPVVCLTWSPGSGGASPAMVLTIGDDVALAEPMRPVDVTGTGALVADRVFVPPSKGALVRGVVPGQDPTTGAIFLVTDLGLRYGVPSMEVATALGLGDTTRPAPEAILRLLPLGPPLDPQAALELFDPRLAAEQLAGG